MQVVNWPLRDGGIWAWAMLGGIVAIATCAGLVANSRAMGGVCFAALAIASWRLWLPVTFEFRSRGVVTRVLGRSRQIPWSQIARFEVRRHGLLLFADNDTSPIASLRAVYVRWNRQRSEILEVVRFYTTTRVSVASTRTFMKDVE